MRSRNAVVAVANPVSTESRMSELIFRSDSLNKFPARFFLKSYEIAEQFRDMVDVLESVVDLLGRT